MRTERELFIMKKITVKRNCLDVNGNSKFLYNFIDTESELDQKELNKKFSSFGRMTKKGINSQLEPFQVNELIHRVGAWNNMPVGIALGKAQKEIDICNNRNGCSSCCSAARQGTCEKLAKHTALMSELSYVNEFLSLDITEEE